MNTCGRRLDQQLLRGWTNPQEIIFKTIKRCSGCPRQQVRSQHIHLLALQRMAFCFKQEFPCLVESHERGCCLGHELNGTDSKAIFIQWYMSQQFNAQTLTINVYPWFHQNFNGVHFNKSASMTNGFHGFWKIHLFDIITQDSPFLF